MNHSFFRPELECLSDRIMLSASALPLAMPLPTEAASIHYSHAENRVAENGLAVHGHGFGIIDGTSPRIWTHHTGVQTVSPMVHAVPAPSQATIDLTPCDWNNDGLAHNAPTLKIHLKAKDGTTYDQTWNIADKTKWTVVLDMVTQNLKQAGWSYTTSGMAIIISGHTDAKGNLSGPSEVSANVKEYKEAGQPGISTTDGVNKVQGFGGSATPWIVTFEPIDGTNQMTEDATFNLTVDGTTVSVSLTTGMSASQAASALYTAMVNAGFPDVTLNSDGLGVTFLQNTSHATASDVSETWSDNGTGSPGGLYTMIDIAQIQVYQQ